MHFVPQLSATIIFEKKKYIFFFAAVKVMKSSNAKI